MIVITIIQRMNPWATNDTKPEQFRVCLYQFDNDFAPEVNISAPTQTPTPYVILSFGN